MMPASGHSNDQLSYWERETFFKPLDAIVLGSGIVGLNAAIYIKEQRPEWEIAVVERGALPLGASTRNAGFACFGSATELLDDLNQSPEDLVWRIVEKRWVGLQRLRKRLGDQAIGYSEVGGYELFREGDLAFEECLDHLDELNRRMAAITGLPRTFVLADQKIGHFGFQGVRHLILNQAEGQIHTGKMMAALLSCATRQGIRLFNGIQVDRLEPAGDRIILTTAQGWEIQAGYAVVATNGFARNLLPNLELRPARNQVLITHPVENLSWEGTFHYDRGYYYFRTVDRRILLGGGRNLAPEEETTTAFGTTPVIREALLSLLKEVVLPGYPVSVDLWWSGILGLGTVKAPIIEQVAPRVFTAVRLGGMGVAIGTLVGEEAAQLVLQQETA